MADEELRELERRWQESGNPEDEARYLRAALRAGVLDGVVLERARLLGHEPAGQALGAEPLETVGWEELAGQIGAWGQEACVRASLAFAMASVPWPGQWDGPDDRLLAVLQSVEAWLLSPGPQAEAGIRDALELLDAVHANWSVASFCGIADSVCRTVLEPELAQRHLTEVFSQVRRVRRHPATLRKEVLGELCGWVLGRADAVAERLAKRGKWLVHLSGLVRRLLPFEDELLACTSEARVYRLGLNPPAALELPGPDARRDLYAAALTPGDQLIVGDLDGRLYACDPRDPQVEPVPFGGESSQRRCVRDLACSPRRLVAACDDDAVHVWDAVDLTPQGQLPVANAGKVICVSIADDDRVLAGGREGAVVLLDAGGRELRRWTREGTQPVAMRFLPGGDHALIAWYDGLLERVSLGDAVRVPCGEAGRGSLHDLALSPDGTLAATLAGDVRLFDVTRGELVRTWEVFGTHLCLAFAGRALLTGARVGGVFRFELG